MPLLLHQLPNISKPQNYCPILPKNLVTKLRETSELKKQQIVETEGAKDYVWVIKDKDVFPIQVSKGLNDGSFTEIRGNIKESDLVATGVNQSAPTDTKSTNPFMPKMPSKKKRLYKL